MARCRKLLLLKIILLNGTGFRTMRVVGKHSGRIAPGGGGSDKVARAGSSSRFLCQSVTDRISNRRFTNTFLAHFSVRAQIYFRQCSTSFRESVTDRFPAAGGRRRLPTNRRGMPTGVSCGTQPTAPVPPRVDFYQGALYISSKVQNPALRR